MPEAIPLIVSVGVGEAVAFEVGEVGLFGLAASSIGARVIGGLAGAIAGSLVGEALAADQD